MSNPLGQNRSQAWGYGAILGFVLLAYFPAGRAGFVWNDDLFLTENPLIKAPDGLFWFWLTKSAPDYWPLTSTSLWLEWRLWGMHPAGYHATNLLLHVAGAALLWRILRGLAVPGALFGALLFAVHPVNVESVAWITQRKNLLALLFFLLSVRWFLQSEAEARPPLFDRRWGLSLAAFVLALLSKGSVAPLPVVLAGLIRWRRPFRAPDRARLAPFFAVATAFAAVDVWFQTHGAGIPLRPAGPVERILAAGAAIWFYLGKALLPLDLIFIYPRWRVDISDWRWWIPALAAIGATAVLAKAAQSATGDARTRRRGWLAAWLYFCLMLGPALGFTDVYFMRYSLVADHYQHLALIGPMALAGAALSSLARASPGIPRHPIISGLSRCLPGLILGALGFLTWRQCGYYRDAETLYRETLARNPGCSLAHHNLGNVLSRSGRVAEALGHYRTALQLSPDDAQTENDLGVALARLDRPAEAQIHYAAALRLDPACAEADFNWGLMLKGGGQFREAADKFEAALRILPRYPDAADAQGSCLYALGLFEEAASAYQRALQLGGNTPGALNRLGSTLLRLNQPEAAIARFQQALRIDPQDGPASYNLGHTYFQLGRLQEAIPPLEQALRSRPDDAEIHLKLALALWAAGRKDDAVRERHEAYRLNPALAR